MANVENGGSRLRKLRNFKRWNKRLSRAGQKAFDAEQASETTLRPRERADNVYRLMVYGYYRELKQAGLIDQLRQHVVERDKDQWRRHRDSDELWVLRLVAKGEQTDQMRKKRDRWAAELKLADINDVRPDLLLGFLHEAGPTDLIENDAKQEVRYPWAECYRGAAAPKRARKVRRKRKEAGEYEDGRADAARGHGGVYDDDDPWLHNT